MEDGTPQYPQRAKDTIWDRMHDDEALLRWLHTLETETDTLGAALHRLQSTILGVISVMEERVEVQKKH